MNKFKIEGPLVTWICIFLMGVAIGACITSCSVVDRVKERGKRLGDVAEKRAVEAVDKKADKVEKKIDEELDKLEKKL